MDLATDPPGFGCRERLTRTQQQSKGKTNMSAKALAACSFEPAAEPTAATDHPAPKGLAAEIQFRENLWRDYRRDAIHAGFTTAQATEYASALSAEMDLAVGESEMAPVGRGWFYQSQARVVRRTITSGLIEFARWEKHKAPPRIAAAGASMLARRFRWWNAGGKS